MIFFILFVNFELKKWINIVAEESLHNLKNNLSEYLLKSLRIKESKFLGRPGTGAFSYTRFSHLKFGRSCTGAKNMS